ncbi:MAG: MFS transporter [Geminicoccaceae bacterium]
MAARTLDPARPAAESVALFILLSVSLGHLLNDMMQSALLSIYPVIKAPLGLSFAQIGIITLTFQLTASVLQPAVGLYTDKHPKPFSLPVGMASTLCGIILLSTAHHFLMVLAAAACIGVGSSIFHPEASRVARLASGGRFGFAQSVFQVGGNSGQALGPLLMALLVVPYGQGYTAWFGLAALIGIVVLGNVGLWYRRHMAELRARPRKAAEPHGLSQQAVLGSLAALVSLMFADNFYGASISSYLPFYLIDRFGISVSAAQLHLFVFLAAAAVGTFLGGPISDRIGKKRVLMLAPILVLPFTLALPHVPLAWTGPVTVAIGLIMAAAFPVIVVYAQELMPGRIGLVGGLFFGLAFGLGGIGAAVLGWLADLTSLGFVYQLCAFLPALGLAVLFLPDLDRLRRSA